MHRSLKKYGTVLAVMSLATTTFAGVPHCTASQPLNLQLVKKRLIAYYNFGHYREDINAVIAEAKHYLEKRLAENEHSAHPKKLALVLDIDETSLSNYPYMKKRGFSSLPKAIKRDLLLASDPPIVSTLKLFRFSQAHHIAVFFITGRTTDFKAATEKNLHTAGYNNWSGLYFRPENYPPTASAAPYKARTRKQIERAGYDIVASIGDQRSDLSGGYADRGFKLPNPYYFVK